MPAQLAPTCSRLGPDPAEPPEHPMEGGQEAPGGRSLAAEPSPTPTAVQKPQPNRGVGAAHTKALGCVPARLSHRPRFTALQPEAPAHPESAATAPSTPGVLQTQNCGCPSMGWETSTSCSLWPEGNRKHNRAMPSSDVIKTRLLPPPGHEVQSQQALRSLFLRPIFGVSEHLGSN